MRIVLDTSDLSDKGGAFISTLTQGAKAALMLQASAAYNRIVQGSYWTNRSGQTRRSFAISRPGPLHARISSKSKVATFLDGGTKPHKIVARRAPLLVFYWAKMGTMFYGKGVNHPGTRAKRFVHIETIIGEGQLRGLTERAADNAVRNVGLG